MDIDYEVNRTSSAIATNRQTGNTFTGQLIVIDPGHGGKDPGARGVSGVDEKAIVLQIALKLRDELLLRGAKVLMTRDTDVFIPLDNRAAFAERYKADIFISIHADSASNIKASGVTILIGRTASNKSRRGAWCVKKAIMQSDISCRVTRKQSLRVLEKHSRPAILIECGFLSNDVDAKRLVNSWYQKKLINSIADGLVSYFK